MAQRADEDGVQPASTVWYEWADGGYSGQRRAAETRSRVRS